MECVLGRVSGSSFRSATFVAPLRSATAPAGGIVLGKSEGGRKQLKYARAVFERSKGVKGGGRHYEITPEGITAWAKRDVLVSRLWGGSRYGPVEGIGTRKAWKRGSNYIRTVEGWGGETRR